MFHCVYYNGNHKKNKFVKIYAKNEFSNYIIIEAVTGCDIAVTAPIKTFKYNYPNYS
jgi:hypothetical protein